MPTKPIFFLQTNYQHCKFLFSFLSLRGVCYQTERISTALVMSRDDLPLVTFGVLADVQYADCDDRPASYDATKIRFYRNALNQIDKAFRCWKDFPKPVSFALQLGDVIDGLNSTFGKSQYAIEQTLSKFESHSTIPTFHTVGNHELYNFSRKALSELFQQSVRKMNISPCLLNLSDQQSYTSSNLYYKFCPSKDLKFISLDCFDVSVLGCDRDDQRYIEAAKILESYHNHDIFEDWDCNGNLQDIDVRFQQMNGGLGQGQLEWLEEELEDSDNKKQKVVVFGHVNLSPESSDWSCLLWNYDDVISCFHRHQCVIAYLSGHSHVSGYSKDSHGIHYVVLSGVIETMPDSSAFVTVSVFPNRIEIKGSGREEDRILMLDCKRDVQIIDETHLETTSIPVKIFA